MVNDLLTRVKGIYQKLRLKVSALKNTLVQRLQKGEAKLKASSSSRSPKASKKK